MEITKHQYLLRSINDHTSKMKFALVLLAIVAFATADKTKVPDIPGKGELAKDIQDFLNLVPVEEIMSLTLQYLAEDAEFQKAFEYLQSEEFKQLVKDVEDLPEVRELMNYIQKQGLDIYHLINLLNKFLELPPIEAPKLALLMGTSQIKGGIRGYLDELKALLPVEKINALFQKKLAESKAFADFINQLKSENFQKIVNKISANEKFQNLLKKAKEAGVDLEEIKKVLETIFGIRVPSKHGFFYISY